MYASITFRLRRGWPAQSRERAHPKALTAHRARRLVLDDHRGSDGDPVIEIDHVLVGHAEAARRDRLSDRLRLVGTMDAVKRRAEIERPRPKRVLDPAFHVLGQIGPAA